MTSTMTSYVLAIGVLLSTQHMGVVHSQTLATDEAEILWDEWGVPHIFGDNLPAAVYAVGYAQAKLHGNLLLTLYAVNRGKAAEYFGLDYAQTDAETRAFEILELGEAAYERLTERELALDEAFAEGFNDYVSENLAEFSPPLLQAFPVTGKDIATYQYFQYIQFMYASSRTARLYDDDNELLSVDDRAKKSDTKLKSATDGSVMYAHELDYSKAFGIDHTDPLTAEAHGSNTWAINGNKSDGNGAKLLMNPHLAYSGLTRWVEFQITVESEDFNVYGAALVGMPMPAIAFTNNLGWTHTVNRVQNYVNYKVPLVNSTHYMYNGEELALESTTYPIKIRSGPGANDHITIDFVLEKTVHGAVFDKNDDFVLASRRGGIERTSVLKQRLDMIEARNLTEFKTALSENQFGFFHTCGATKDGDIFNYFGGYVPKRNENLGDWFYWEKPVDGSTNETFFTDIHTFEELPKVENPDTHFVHQANEPPWTMTWPPVEELNPDNFPSYMSLPPYMFSRAQSSSRLMVENNNITFEKMIELKHTTRHELAERTINALVAEGIRKGSSLSHTMKDALRVLRRWDRNLDADSVGAVLFLQWSYLAAEDPRNTAAVLTPDENDEEPFADFLFKTPWSIDDPFDTPKHFSNATRALEALEEALRYLKEEYTSLSPIDIRTPYGEIFRLQNPDQASPNATLPGHGGFDTFRNTQWSFNTNFRSSTPSNNGDTWVCVVEFTENGPRAKSLIGYGNGSQGPHVNDQFGLYAEKKLRDVWLEYATIEDNLESRETLTYSSESS